MAKQDLALGRNGDIQFDENGDFVVIDSIRQGIQIKLRWIKGEWLFNPNFGVPYFDSIFTKSVNVALIENILRTQILSVDGVVSVGSVTIKVDSQKRTMKANFTAMTTQGEIESEVDLIRGLWNNS